LICVSFTLSTAQNSLAPTGRAAQACRRGAPGRGRGVGRVEDRPEPRGRAKSVERRRFPAPRDIEEYDRSCFIVRDNSGLALTYVYFEKTNRADAPQPTYSHVALDVAETGKRRDSGIAAPHPFSD
jgi:hypothetical protein